MSLGEFWERNIEKLSIGDDSHIDFMDCPLINTADVEAKDKLTIRLSMDGLLMHEETLPIEEDMHVNSVKVIKFRNSFGMKTGYGVVFGERE